MVNRVSLYISQFFQFGHCLSHRGDFLSFVHKNRCMLAIYIYFVCHFFAGIVFSFSYLFHQIFAAFFLVGCVCVLFFLSSRIFHSFFFARSMEFLNIVRVCAARNTKQKFPGNANKIYFFSEALENSL